MGPLQGVRVVEMAGIGPGPFAAMMLSDMGADVIRIDRIPKGQPTYPALDNMQRGRPNVAVDLKHPEGVELVLRLVRDADALIEGFRPGVMERLGLGPEDCLHANPRLVFGRMTGWGQEGPLAPAVGHDINYIALTGALHGIGRKGERPIPPLNLVGDFGGGGMLLAFGLVCGILEARKSGAGQVVDAAMIDGASILMSMFHGLAAMGFHHPERGTNMLDGGSHFYDTYETKDGKYVSIGSIEPQFYAELIKLTGLEGQSLPKQMSREDWPMMREKFDAIFKSKTREQWCKIMEGSDVCFAPILTMEESMAHPHMVHRQNYVEVGGLKQPAPAPRFDRTVPEVQGPPSHPGADTDTGLTAWGLSKEEIATLRQARAIG